MLAVILGRPLMCVSQPTGTHIDLLLFLLLLCLSSLFLLPFLFLSTPFLIGEPAILLILGVATKVIELFLAILARWRIRCTLAISPFLCGLARSQRQVLEIFETEGLALPVLSLLLLSSGAREINESWPRPGGGNGSCDCGIIRTGLSRRWGRGCIFGSPDGSGSRRRQAGIASRMFLSLVVFDRIPRKPITWTACGWSQG